MATITQAEKLRYRNERIRRIKDEGQIRRVECPFCGAEVGEDCHGPSWYANGTFHKDRRALAGVA